MPFVSLTRLRIRSIRFLPWFMLQASRANNQVKKAAGFQGGSLLNDKHRTFWTMTAWDSQESMRAYMTTGSHKKAMPHLLHWCDEASVAHWTQEETALPSWAEADRRMRASGRPSKVHKPSPHHADLSFDAQQTSAGSPIRPA